MCNLFQMLEADDRCTYLGLPNIIGRNKTTLLGFLKERVKSQIKIWEGKCISRPGKEILVKTVAQTLPSYAMSVFLIPFEITRDIEKSLSKYWWSSSQQNKSSISWMSWDRMAKHKNSGGLGFRNFRNFNVAMLGKQGWRFISNPDSLVSRLFKAKYYADGDYLNASLGHNPSFIWRSVLEAKQLLRDGVRWRVGNGKRIKVLGQPWLVTGANPFISTISPVIDNINVASLLCTDKKAWDAEVIKDVFNNRDQQRILEVKLDASNEEDEIFWNLEATGIYLVKSAYNLLQLQGGEWNSADNTSVWKVL